MLCFADSDSFLKWGAHLATELPPSWGVELVVLRSNATPSQRQIAEAISNTRFHGKEIRVLDHNELKILADGMKPDLVVAAARGFVVSAMLDLIIPESPDRPVVIAGLPGVSFPALAPGIRYREASDIFLLHSRTEVEAYRVLADKIGSNVTFELASLPFLRVGQDHAHLATLDQASQPTDNEQPDKNTIVFATQAKVPRLRSQRELILLSLLETAYRRPDILVVIKVRAHDGETQTHAESLPYPHLLTSLADSEGFTIPPNLRVESGPMSEHLTRACGLVSVSSTALIEALAYSVPVVVLEDFGVSRKLINMVFADSGLLGTLDDVIAGGFRRPDEYWLDHNYFHGSEHNTWLARTHQLLAVRDQTGLDPKLNTRQGLSSRLRRSYYRHQAFIPVRPTLRYRMADWFWRSVLYLNDVRKSWQRR